MPFIVLVSWCVSILDAFQGNAVTFDMHTLFMYECFKALGYDFAVSMELSQFTDAMYLVVA